MYTSSVCGTGPVNQQEFSILDAINIGLKPKPRKQCWICPLGCLFVPSTHPDREQVQATLLKITNKGRHPIYANQPFFELSRRKIHQLASVHYKMKIVGPILKMLENISMNKLPPEVKQFVNNCDIKKRDQYTLIGSLDSPPMCCTTADFTDLHFLSILEPPTTEGYADYNKIQIELCAALLQNNKGDVVRAVYNGIDFVSDDDNDPDVIEATPDDNNDEQPASQAS